MKKKRLQVTFSVSLSHTYTYTSLSYLIFSPLFFNSCYCCEETLKFYHCDRGPGKFEIKLLLQKSFSLSPSFVVSLSLSLSPKSFHKLFLSIARSFSRKVFSLIKSDSTLFSSSPYSSTSLFSYLLFSFSHLLCSLSPYFSSLLFLSVCLFWCFKLLLHVEKLSVCRKINTSLCKEDTYYVQYTHFMSILLHFKKNTVFSLKTNV